MADPSWMRLPLPDSEGPLSLEQVIFRRRSVRHFQKRPLNGQQLSQLLWAAQGVTGEVEGFTVRCAPSAGALYPIRIYVADRTGLRQYSPTEHALRFLTSDDRRGQLSAAAWGQASVREAAVNIILVADYLVATSKYGERGVLYVHMEAGHIAQNIHLEATALSLGSVPVGAFEDDKVKNILALSIEETPLYIIPVGYPR